MGVLVNTGKAAIARGIKDQPIFLAWGTGDPSWEDSPPAENVEAIGLTNEIGRKQLARALYVERDENGNIPLSNGTWRVCENPTGNLYCEFLFDYEDGGDAKIREVAIFIGCQLKSSVPEGQTYFTTEDFDDLGTMLVITHLDVTHALSPYVRGSYETVLEF